MSRPKTNSNPVTLERLEAAHRKVAAMVVEDPVFIPIFKRLEAELILHRKQTDAVTRARAVAVRQRAIA